MVARELPGCCRGIVQCDGYAAYEQFEQMKGITLAGCWAHVRKKIRGCSGREQDPGYTGDSLHRQVVQDRV